MAHKTPRAVAAERGRARGEPQIGAYLGATLKGHRQTQHLTIQDVAALSGISRGILSRIENGQAMPSLDTLARVSRPIGVSLAALFNLETAVE